ncbi:MAG: hypothetical protein ACTS2F_06385 [Thainema sp.]
MTFRIPDQHKAGFEKLASITESEFNDLLSSIKKLSPGFRSPQITVEDLDDSELDIGEAQIILDSVIAFFAAKDNIFSSSQGETDDNFWVDTAAKSVFLNYENAGEYVQIFKERLSLILKHGESIDISVKSIKAALENERLMTDVNITTDIRPIFSGGKSYHFDKAIIVHSLKIEYRDFESAKEIFLALDFNDLQILREAIDQAEAKEFALENYLKDSHILLVSDRSDSKAED